MSKQTAQAGNARETKVVCNSRTLLGFDLGPSGDSFQSFQQNLAFLHNLTSVQPVMLSIYLYSVEQMLIAGH